MYILRESHRFEDFEINENFGFLMLFCNQNDLSVKIWVFAKSAHQNTKSCRNEKTSSYFERFFSGKGPSGIFSVPDDIWPIFGRKNQFWPNLLMHASTKIFQNRFFSIFEKLHEMYSKCHIDIKKRF